MESFQLPDGDLSQSFSKYNDCDKLQIIELGIIFFNLLKKTQMCLDDKKIKELLRNEREKHKNTVNELKIGNEAKIQQAIKLINEDRIRLEQTLHVEKDKSRDYWLEREKEVRRGYEQQLEKYRIKCESTFLHKQNSTILGQDGENFTFFELNKFFPKAEIEDCRKKPGRGDFILTEGDFVMMIETKNYKKNVLKPEVDKFYRDVENNDDITCAILVSLKSGVCAKADFAFEVCNGKPILFLHKVKDNISNIPLAVKFFKLIAKSKLNLYNQEILVKVKNIIPLIKRNFRNQKKTLNTFKKKFDDIIVKQENMVEEIFKLIF